MNSIEELLLSRNKENEKMINEQVALQQRDVNFKYTLDGFFSIANEINLFAKNIGNFRISFEQQKFFDSLSDAKDVILIAGTGFGKSWLIAQNFANQFDSIKHELTLNYIHIVPNDILVTQSLREVRKLLGDDSDVNVSEIFLPGKSNFIVVTPEGFFGLANDLEKHVHLISKIIFDEAHLMTEKESRSEFYAFICKEIIKKWKKEYGSSFQQIFMSPFVKDIEAFAKLLEININEVNVLKLTGFSSSFLIKDPNSEIWLAKNTELKVNPSFDDGIKLLYFSSFNTARTAFELRIQPMKSNIATLIEKITQNSEVYEAYKQIIETYEGFTDNSYDVFKGWSVGVGLYHANQPNLMKDFTYLAAKNGFLKEIYSTSAILNGADLPIEEIIIDKTREGKKVMSYNDFMNLSGRAGRYRAGRPQILGKISIVNTFENNSWFEDNKSNILSRKKVQSSWIDNDEPWFVNQSIQAANDDKEHKKAYFLEPRINPVVTKKLINDKELTEKLTKNVLKMLLNFSNYKLWNGETEVSLRQLTEEIFKIYGASRGKGWFDFTNWHSDKPMKKKALQYFLRMFKYFSEEVHMSILYRSYFLSENSSQYLNANKKFEDSIRLYKQYSKYQLFMYFNHILEMARYHELIFLNLYDIYRAATLDFEVVNFLARERKVLFIANEKQKANKLPYFEKVLKLNEIEKELQKNKLPLNIKVK